MEIFTKIYKHFGCFTRTTKKLQYDFYDFGWPKTSKAPPFPTTNSDQFSQTKKNALKINENQNIALNLEDTKRK